VVSFVMSRCRLSVCSGIVHSVKYTHCRGQFRYVKVSSVRLYRYCPQCKVDTSEVVLAGERLKESKKKGKMASAQSATSRDWGKVVVVVINSAVCLLLAATAARL